MHRSPHKQNQTLNTNSAMVTYQDIRGVWRLIDPPHPPITLGLNFLWGTPSLRSPPPLDTDLILILFLVSASSGAIDCYVCVGSASNSTCGDPFTRNDYLLENFDQVSCDRGACLKRLYKAAGRAMLYINFIKYELLCTWIFINVIKYLRPCHN